MLKIKNIDFSYANKVLDKVSFELKHEKILGVVGKSGGGKSTLLKIIGGYLSPESGEISIDGEKQRKVEDLLIPGFKKVSLVHQDFGLDLYHTVEENVREKVLGLPLKLQNKLIRDMFDLLELKGIRNQKAIHISGGEQQRLSIARALAGESDLVLLDEPFVHLDSQMRSRLIKYILALKEIRKTSFIIVTHNGDEILGLCDEIIYLKKGKIVRKGTPSQFYNNPKSVEEGSFFGFVNCISLAGKRILFRPNQFNKTNGTKLSIFYQSSKKTGPLIHNYFLTEKSEEIILFNFETMEKINHIYV